MIENFAAIYSGIYNVNLQMLRIAEDEAGLSEPETELLNDFAHGLNHILDLSQTLERTARVLLNIARGHMN